MSTNYRIKSETHKIDNGIMYEREYQLMDKSVDVIKVFDELWQKFRRNDFDGIKQSLEVMTDLHDGFIDVFSSEENFKSSSTDTKKIALETLNTMILDMRDNERYMECNGASLLMLWLVTLIRKETDAQQHIEKVLSEFRSEHNI